MAWRRKIRDSSILIVGDCQEDTSTFSGFRSRRAVLQNICIFSSAAVRGAISETLRSKR